jgi:hypothetical protein
LEEVKREFDLAKADNAHLHAQVASMAAELGQKNEEIRKYHAEQAAVFSQIRELVGHPGEVVAKVQLYDQLGEEGDLKSTKQAIPVLVKYARRITNMFAEIQKIFLPTGTPRRVLYQGTPGSPSETLYEVLGEMIVLQDPAPDAEPSQQKDDSRPRSSGRDPERTHSSGARRKSTWSVKYARRITNLFAEIQKILLPTGTPRRVLYQGTPGSPLGTLYEVVGEVTVLQDPAPNAEPNQQKEDSRPGSSGRDPERTHSSGARRKSTRSAVAGSTRSGRGQFPAPRNSDRSRTSG